MEGFGENENERTLTQGVDKLSGGTQLVYETADKQICINDGAY